MIPAVCFNCGASISAKYDAFKMMRDEIFEPVSASNGSANSNVTIISNIIEGDPDDVNEMLEIYYILGIETDNIHCRISLNSSVIPSEF